jgi:ASCH domain
MPEIASGQGRCESLSLSPVIEGVPMKAIIVDEPWISLILRGEKTWEMRKGNCNHRGPIALIRKGSGQVVGTANIVGSLPSLSQPETYAAGEPHHRIPPDRQTRAREDGWTTPWVIGDAKPLTRPVNYKHPYGAVIWVNLDPDVAAAITEQAGVLAAISADTTISTPSKTSRTTAHGRTALRREAKGLIDGERAFITLTDGNITNGHFYLRSILEFFPEDAIGGSDRSQTAKATLTLDYHPGQKDVRTDITGPNRLTREKRSSHCFFRERTPTKDFFKRSGAAAGDSVVIERLASHHFSIFLLKASGP